MSRRLMGAPADVRASDTMQRVAAALDLAFETGHAATFSRVGVYLCRHCIAISLAQGLAPWWKIPPQDWEIV